MYGTPLRYRIWSKIKSCMGSYLWHPDEMEVMRKNNPLPKKQPKKVATSTAPKSASDMLDMWIVFFRCTMSG